MTINAKITTAERDLRIATQVRDAIKLLAQAMRLQTDAAAAKLINAAMNVLEGIEAELTTGAPTDA